MSTDRRIIGFIRRLNEVPGLLSELREAGLQLMDCWRCRRHVRTSLCAGCQVVRYCSKECQSADWRGAHRHVCDLVQRAAEQWNGAMALDAWLMDESALLIMHNDYACTRALAQDDPAALPFMQSVMRAFSERLGMFQPHPRLCLLLLRVLPSSLFLVDEECAALCAAAARAGASPAFRAGALDLMLGGRLPADVPVAHLTAYDLGGVGRKHGGLVSACCLACDAHLPPNAATATATACARCRFARFCDARCMELGAGRQRVSVRLVTAPEGPVRVLLRAYSVHDAAICECLREAAVSAPRPGTAQEALQGDLDADTIL